MTKGKGNKKVPNNAVHIELPMMPVANTGYVQRHVEVQLDEPQSRALRRVFNALMQRSTVLRSGRFVRSAPDTMRYILERIADATPDGIMNKEHTQ